jgi:hypothetical protein
MTRSHTPPEKAPEALPDGPALEWDRCTVGGKRFPTWPKLWAHKSGHSRAEVDARTIGNLRHELW